MNKFELDKVMECFGFEKSDNYKINGCNYYHDGRYFTIVNDNIPYELALLIRKKYDNDIYKIRAGFRDVLKDNNYDQYIFLTEAQKQDVEKVFGKKEKYSVI